jgi:hypothetical protein
MPRQNVPAPLQCAATSKRSGERCKRFVRPGCVTCRFHGSARRDALTTGDARTTLQWLLIGEARPVWEVLAEHVATLDAFAREARVQVTSGEPVSPADLARVVDLAQRAITASKVALDAGVAERLAEVREGKTAREAGRVIVAALDAVIGPLLDAVPAARRGELAAWSNLAAAAALQGGPVPAAPRPVAALYATVSPAGPVGVESPAGVPDSPRTAVSGPESGESGDVESSGGRSGAPRLLPGGPGSSDHDESPGPVPVAEVVSLADQRRYLASIGRGRAGAASVIDPDRNGGQ